MNELLRRKGWSLNEGVDHRKSYAVILACQYENVPVLKYLVQKGADVNIGDYFGMTPLHYACEYNNIEILGMISDAGADINALNLENRSPLTWACFRGHVEAVKALLERGADVRGALSAICEQSSEISDEIRLSLTDLLISNGAKVDCETICDAIKLGNTKLVEKLVQNYSESIQTNLLETCIQEGNVAILEILLQNGAKSNKSETFKYAQIIDARNCN